jgi:AraC family transcriptional regulator of adaptative response/methylated-DNA-[protein]-cysteine methyltransferase
MTASSSSGADDRRLCRPSCPARKPQPKNVDFFATAREAVFAGYRPCKRCKPMTAAGEPPTWVRQLLSHVDRSPEQRISDDSIRKLGIDPARARRYFQSNYGMTFQAYCRGRRLGSALAQIRKGVKLDHVTLGHGYESHSGFRDAFARTFGTPPGKAQNTDCIVVTWIESPLGPLIAGATETHLVLLEFTERRMLEAQFVPSEGLQTFACPRRQRCCG